MVRVFVLLSIVVLTGKIVGIDYLGEKMLLREKRNHTVNVYILPSTTIEGKNDDFQTIADLKKGANVKIFTSVRGTHTDAEIIELL